MTGRAGFVASGVLETCLYARNLDETAAFYERVLGLQRFAGSEGRHVFFRCGSGVFLLFNPEETRRTGGEVPPHGADGPGHVAFAIQALDLPDWRDHVESLGVEIEAEVGWPSGGTSLYLRDPAGNSVELTSPIIWSIPEESDDAGNR